MNTNQKILVIDDEDVVLDSCTRVLAGEHYQTATARNGTLGLQQVQAFQPDLVFVDLKMPGISGFEVIERLHVSDPTVVTIVITGYATLNSAVQAMKQGAFDFLPKPFTPEELRLITRRGLERQAAHPGNPGAAAGKETLREHFAAIVSHELKSPLSAVQQGLFALAADLSRQLTAEQKDRFERLKVRIDEMVKLIHRWLQGMSGDFQKLRESFAPMSVAPAIRKAVEVVQPEATRKSIDIVTSLAEPARPVLGHEGSLTEALVNLIGNAVRYSHPQGQVQVKAVNNGDAVVISVADSGVGIVPEDMPFIFQDFYRGRPSPAAEHGCGLGLAITKRIVEAHDGAISVESQPGKGSVFVIRLPEFKANPSSRPSAPVAALAGTYTCAGGGI